MLDKYFGSAFTLERLRHGPSSPLLDGFARSLHDDGYSWLTARAYLRASHHLGRFQQSKDIALVALQPDTIAVFRLHLKDCRCPKPRGSKTEDTVRGAKCFLRYLWNVGAVPSLDLRNSPGHRWCRDFATGSESTVVPRKQHSRGTALQRSSFSRSLVAILASMKLSAFELSFWSVPVDAALGEARLFRALCGCFCAIWLPRGSVEQAWTPPSRRSQDGVWPHYRAGCRQTRSSSYCLLANHPHRWGFVTAR